MDMTTDRTRSRYLARRSVCWLALSFAILIAGTSLTRSGSTVSWGDDGDEAQSIDVVGAALASTLRDLRYGGRTSGRALVDGALGALRAAGAEGLTRHQTKLLANTVRQLSETPPPSPEEAEFRAKWIAAVTTRLAGTTITEAETAEVLKQCDELRARFGAVVDELRPAEAARFAATSLRPAFDALSAAAVSLTGGGAMHPMTGEQMDGLVSDFRRIADDADQPTNALTLALVTVHPRVYEFCTGWRPDDMPPEVQDARSASVRAGARRREQERQRDEQTWEAAMAETVLGSYTRDLLASDAALDALALWHELLSATRPPQRSATAIVAIELWREGSPCGLVSGDLSYGPEGASQARLVVEEGDAWSLDVWDGLALSLAPTRSAVASDEGSAEAEAGGEPLPLPPPVRELSHTDLLGHMAQQASGQRLLWRSVLDLWGRAEGAAIDLSELQACGLALLMWNSQPRASSAVRAADGVVLRDASGQTVARLAGEGKASLGPPAALPSTIAVELTRRRVSTTRTQTVIPTAEAGQEALAPVEREATAPIDLGVRSARLQFRCISGVVLLDEYKVYREDGTPLCIVTFSDVQVKAAQ